MAPRSLAQRTSTYTTDAHINMQRDMIVLRVENEKELLRQLRLGEQGVDCGIAEVPKLHRAGGPQDVGGEGQPRPQRAPGAGREARQAAAEPQRHQVGRMGQHEGHARLQRRQRIVGGKEDGVTHEPRW